MHVTIMVKSVQKRDFIGKKSEREKLCRVSVVAQVASRHARIFWYSHFTPQNRCVLRFLILVAVVRLRNKTLFFILK